MDKLENSYKYSDFDRIFNPRRIAIIGVSSKGAGFGSGSFLALQALGYNGEILPVNPKGGTFNGMNIYRNLDEIDGDIDFAIIAVPAAQVPEAIEACLNKGSAGVEILSAGFSETKTKEGISLEEEIKKIAKKGIRVIGPNCFGIYCPKSGLNIPPGFNFSKDSGHIAFLSQSGGMAENLGSIGKWLGIGFSKMVSFGNGVDLREVELLEYLGDDPDTKIISMYIEGVKDGREFFRVLRDVSAKKPVIIYKGGLSDAGHRAVASHTASMGGEKKLWEAAARQCNAIMVEGVMEMAETCLAFSMLPSRAFRNVSIVGGGGALGVTASDAAESFGLKLPVFEGERYDRIMSLLPQPGSSAGNPVDVANPLVPHEYLKEVMLISGDDERIDIQIMIQLLHVYNLIAGSLGVTSVKDITPYKELASAVKDVMAATDKPVVLVIPNYCREIDHIELEKMLRVARQTFLDEGVLVFNDIKDAFGAINHVSNYYLRRDN